MSEFFLEIFSEEIPANLQKSARQTLLENFIELFEKKNISFKKGFCYSVPNRLVILFEGLPNQIIEKKDEIRGPSTKAPEQAIEGFLRSNNITKEEIFKKEIEKGEFYFYNKPEKKYQTHNFLTDNIPFALNNIQWKKSMKWANYDLHWGRPLKSILATFKNKTLEFKFHHIESSNFTFLDKEFEDKKKVFKNFKSYINYFKKKGIIIDHSKRKEFIRSELLKHSNKKNLKIEIDEKLIQEVTDLVEQPKILSCKFDRKFLKIPREILIITMRYHQKYFPTFDNKNNISNEFLVVANNEDQKGLIKLGNERVVEARLNDAEFFWNKNKSQNLVKQIAKLKNVNYFKGLGSYYDKIQRMRKLGAIVSDQLLISKEKIELSSSICKVDLTSDLVGEFPELQGIMGGYFAVEQGFEKDVALAVREHYLPNGLESKTPKKPFSLALSLTDKLDTLVGFFGINLKPTSSKDPFALRRAALGIIRLIVENNKEFKIKDLINYSLLLYQDQGFKFEGKTVLRELTDFLFERLKYYMKAKSIRGDIINSGLSSYGVDNLNKIFRKSFAINKIINLDIGQDVISSYKRTLNILESEVKTNQIELSEITDPGIFKSEYEKNLYKKIKELRKYFLNIGREDDENYDETLKNLASFKKPVFEFFDNIIVNDQDLSIKKNRLELLQMLCKTFENYINFSKIESTL